MSWLILTTRINWFSVSSRRWKYARKACTLNNQIAYTCLTWDACATIIQDEGYWRMWTEVELFMTYCCSKFNLYMLTCWEISKLNLFLCRATVTLHHGQGHQNDHEYTSHAQVYLQAKFECHSLNIFQDITVKLQVKTFVHFEMQLWLGVKAKVIRLRTDYIDL